ncbi:type I-F CRISPR-associated protein Csy2 [Xanthomonas theicola]|uniref:type I-F CRISPR-associated protein Csy2 n=1 Tax=Xanthomonas theicola TaxID=56464 RepID=UPI000FF8AAA5|nr:type I-F CRISPR-associated protein Csy2 [Xanthomonas theicola]QNH26411.1 hypothetical protein G4Q83_19120 [Xanthomonas theicola]
MGNQVVESLYSAGEWLSPHRLHSPQRLLWYADSQPDAALPQRLPPRDRCWHTGLHFN